MADIFNTCKNHAKNVVNAYTDLAIEQGKEPEEVITYYVDAVLKHSGIEEYSFPTSSKKKNPNIHVSFKGETLRKIDALSAFYNKDRSSLLKALVNTIYEQTFSNESHDK